MFFERIQTNMRKNHFCTVNTCIFAYLANKMVFMCVHIISLHEWHHIIHVALEVVCLLHDLFLRFFHVDSWKLNSLLLTSEYHSGE